MIWRLVPAPLLAPALAIALAITPGVGPGLAADSGLKRLTLRQEVLGWEAVGRLDLDGRGFCTGALIATDLVLTAAHCLVEADGVRVDPRQVTFLAGLRDGVAVAERTGARAVLHPGYDPADEDGLRQLASDVALIELAEPIAAAEAAPFATGQAARAGQPVSLVSYARGRSEALSWQRRCTVAGQGSGALLMTCDADFGASGAPVFETSSGRPRIVSVISRGTRRPDGTEVLGPAIERPLAEVKQALRQGRGVWPDSDFAPRRIGTGGTAQAGRRDIGARFLRP